MTQTLNPQTIKAALVGIKKQATALRVSSPGKTLALRYVAEGLAILATDPATAQSLQRQAAAQLTVGNQHEVAHGPKPDAVTGRLARHPVK